MTATTVSDLDPYVLPLPTPASPVVSTYLTGTLHTHLNSCYADSIWQLALLTDNPSAPRLAVHWQTWPDSFREEMRLAAWNLINGQLRPTFLQQHGVRMRARLGMQGVHQTIIQWRRLAVWLKGRGIGSLADCTASVLHDYGLHARDAGHSKSYVTTTLASVMRLWAFDQLSIRPSGIGRPPWEDTGVDGYLPVATVGGGENSTEPLAEQTIGPLLTWAMRMVDDLSGDILAAWAESQRLTQISRASTDTPAGRAALKAYFRSLVASEEPVPTTSVNGKVVLARIYISGLTGASRSQVGHAAVREGVMAVIARRPGLCPLNIPVTGQIGGRPWRAALDFDETPILMRHLGTAAFIVCAYLTGMRPAEILGLRTDCCPDPLPGADGRSGRHLIRGHEYKNATDEYGNHQPAGVERDVPWVGITPVVNAIRVLERTVPNGHLLFDCRIHDPRGFRDRTGSLKKDTLEKRVRAFVAWANQEARALGLPGEVIPDDPHGNIGLVRFRRSLAWHIARRPNGLVALAIQYGHMQTNFSLVSEGYGARSRDGIHDLIDLETARAVADTVAVLHHRRRARMSPAPDERDRIRVAMDRILVGAPERSNGALTVVALAIEADVPRNALTQRHTDLKNEFYQRIKERGADNGDEARLRATIAKLKRTIAAKNKELAQLRADVPALVRVVHRLTLENQQLREMRSDADRNVIPFFGQKPVRPRG